MEPIQTVWRAGALFPEGPSLAPGWAAEGLWGSRGARRVLEPGSRGSSPSTMAREPSLSRREPWGAELLRAPGLGTRSRMESGALSTGQGSDVGPPLESALRAGPEWGLIQGPTRPDFPRRSAAEGGGPMQLGVWPAASCCPGHWLAEL